jgi:hypothetical protein
MERHSRRLLAAGLLVSAPSYTRRASVVASVQHGLFGALFLPHTPEPSSHSHSGEDCGKACGEPRRVAPVLGLHAVMREQAGAFEKLTFVNAA